MLDRKADSINPGPGRPKADMQGPTARDRILNAASELFCRYGINAVGVDAIVELAGTAKTTLYKTFGSKELLVKEVLMKEGQQWRDNLFGELDKIKGSAKKKLLGIFNVLEKWFSDPNYYGCPFINAVGEHDKLDPSIRNVTIEHKKKVLSRIEGLAKECGIRKAGDFAHEFGVIIDGAIVAALITRDPNIARLAQKTAKAVLVREKVL